MEGNCFTYIQLFPVVCGAILPDHPSDVAEAVVANVGEDDVGALQGEFQELTREDLVRDVHSWAQSAANEKKKTTMMRAK